MATRVYHWKHGWIPLDHAAAMSKSKGSEAGARRALATSNAAGHAHDSVVSGTYGGGTHVRGLQPVAAEHLPREPHITAAFSPESRRFALLDNRGQRIGLSHQFDGTPASTSIPEHLADHLQSRGHAIVGVKTGPRGDQILTRSKSGDLKLYAANGSDINQVDRQVVKAPSGNTQAAPAPYAASHTVVVKEFNRADGTPSGRRYGVIKPLNGIGGDTVNVQVADHINNHNLKVIGYERRVITTVGPDGVVRRFKADGSNVDKPVIAKSNAGTLHDIGEWKAVSPSAAIPATGRPVSVMKVQRAYQRGNKTVLIEPKMSEAETEAFLNHVSQAVDATGSSGTDHAVTFHVPTGDRTFAGGRTRGYVYSGDASRVHIAPGAAKASIDRTTGDATGWHMSAGKALHPTLYTLTHELGHIAAHRNGHTPRLAVDSHAFHMEQRTNLSTYGRTNNAEGYAEAFAHHHLAPHSTAATESTHDMSAAAYADRYGWGSVTSWRTGPDNLVIQAARFGDVGALNEARRRGLKV